jgi:hypothetical protein
MFKRKGAEIAETRKGMAKWRCVHHSLIQTLRFFATLCDFAFYLGVRFQLHRYGWASEHAAAGFVVRDEQSARFSISEDGPRALILNEPADGIHASIIDQTAGVLARGGCDTLPGPALLCGESIDLCVGLPAVELLTKLRTL